MASYITILIVLVLLLVFRRLDKKNIQLNKVKRYIDRVISRLELYEKERVESIALQEAHLNELINRVTTLNESLNQRLEIMAEKEAKIESSEELINATEMDVAKLLSSIDKVKVEMNFVDSVNSKIQKTKHELTEMKKDFSDLQVYFKNAKESLISELQSKTKESNENFTIRIDRLKNQILLTEKKLSEKLNNENYVLMNLIKRIKDTFSFSEKNIYSKLEKVKKDIDTELHNMQGHIKKQEEELLKTATYNIHKLGELVKNIETTHINNKNSIIVDYQNQIKGLHDLLDKEKEKFSTRFSQIETMTMDELKLFHNSLSQIDMEHKNMKKQDMEEMQQFVQNLSDKIVNSKLEFQKIEHNAKVEFANKLEKLHKILEDKENMLLKKANNKVSQLTDKVSIIMNQYNKEKESIQQIINEKIAQLNKKSSDILKKVEHSEHTIQSQINNLLKSTESRLTTLETKNTKSLKDDLEFNKKRFSEELDKKLNIVNDGLEKHIHLLTTISQNAEKNLLESKDKYLNDLDNKLTKIRNDMSHTVAQFNELEERLLKNTTDRIKGVNKEYDMKFDELDKQYKEFEKKVTTNITKDIANFQQELNLVLEKYQKTEDQLLSNVKIKILNFDDSLHKLSQDMDNLEKQHQQKILGSFNELSDSLKSKAIDLEKKLSDKSMQIIEKHKLDSKKLSENIKKLEQTLKQKESVVLKKFKDSFKAFNVDLEKIKIKSNRTTEALALNNKKKVDGLFKDFELKLRKGDELLNKSLSQMQNKTKEQIVEMKENFKNLKQNASHELNGFLDASKTHFDKIENTYKTLSKQSTQLEKNFKSTLESYVKRFNDTITDKIKDFSDRLRITNQSTSQASKEFLKQLQHEFEIAKKEVTDKSTHLIQKELEKVEDLGIRVDSINKTIENFLSKTKVLNDAEKLKNQLQEQIGKFNTEIDSVKKERKSLSKLESKISSLKKYGESIEAQISKIMREKKDVQNIASEVQSLMGTIDELNLKVNLFKKEKSQIATLSDKFKSLDSITRKVNKNLDAFSEKEAEIQRLVRSITQVSTSYAQLQKKAEQQSVKFDKIDTRSERIENHLVQLEEKAISLSDTEARFKNLEQKLDDIDPLIAFVDDKVAQLQKWRDWVSPAEEHLKEYLSLADEKIEDLKNTLDRINFAVSRTTKNKTKKDVKPVDSSIPSLPPELIRNVVDLYNNNGWDMQTIADALGLTLQQVKDIIKNNL